MKGVRPLVRPLLKDRRGTDLDLVDEDLFRLRQQSREERRHRVENRRQDRVGQDPDKLYREGGISCQELGSTLPRGRERVCVTRLVRGSC